MKIISQFRLWSFRILAVVISCFLILCGLEILLRVFPGLFSVQVQNLAFSRYGTLPGDIYFHVPSVNIYFQWANYRTRASFNGYHWIHETDEYGFRNPKKTNAKKILLLGDSLIYGHGVNQEQTVTHFLRVRHGHRAYNMARQGDFLYSEYVLLRIYLEEFQPEKVLLFVFGNDFDDLREIRSEIQIRKMPELRRRSYDRIRAQIDALQKERPSRTEETFFCSPVVRLGIFYLPVMNKLVDSAEAEEPSNIDTYYRLILSDLNGRCRAIGAELILISLDVSEDARLDIRREEERNRKLLRSIAAENSIHYYDTLGLFRDCSNCRLPHDGHLSEKGHSHLADFLDAKVLN